MNQPLHMFAPRLISSSSTSGSGDVFPTTRNPTSTVMYLPPSGLGKTLVFEDPLEVRSDDEATRSSWALTSRLHRLKKRHTPCGSSPSSSSSLPSCKSVKKEKSQRRRQKMQEQQQLNQQLCLSRWESQPRSSSSSFLPLPSRPTRNDKTSGGNHQNTNMPRTTRRGCDRPTLPRRQQSMENSRDTDAPTRKAIVNKEARDKAALLSYRHSFSSSAVVVGGERSLSPPSSLRAVSAMCHQGQRGL